MRYTALCSHAYLALSCHLLSFLRTLTALSLNSVRYAVFSAAWIPNLPLFLPFSVVSFSFFFFPFLHLSRHTLTHILPTSTCMRACTLRTYHHLISSDCFSLCFVSRPPFLFSHSCTYSHNLIHVCTRAQVAHIHTHIVHYHAHTSSHTTTHTIPHMHQKTRAQTQTKASHRRGVVRVRGCIFFPLGVSESFKPPSFSQQSPYSFAFSRSVWHHSPRFASRAYVSVGCGLEVYHAFPPFLHAFSFLPSLIFSFLYCCRHLFLFSVRHVSLPHMRCYV